MKKVKRRKKKEEAPRQRFSSMDKVDGIREYFCTLLLGAPGVGKSTYMMDAILDYLEEYRAHYKLPYFPRVIIHDYSGSRLFRETKVDGKPIPCIIDLAKRYGIADPMDIIRNVDKYGSSPLWKMYPVMRYQKQGKEAAQELTETIMHHFRNGFALFDEWTTYVDDKPPDWQIDLGFNRRQYGLEVMYACHMLRAVPLKMCKSAALQKIVLFNTEEDELEKGQLNRFSFAKLLAVAVKLVAQAPRYNKRGQYHVILEKKYKKELIEWLPDKGKYRRLKIAI